MAKTVRLVGQSGRNSRGRSSAVRADHVDLNELLVFTRVVQAGSFTAAARLLGMPKSTVSHKVAGLEERLGSRLLQRTTRKLGLSDAGRIYFGYSERIVAEAEAAERALGSLEESPRGLLRVTAPLSFSMLGPIAADFLKRHPDVRLEVVCTDRRVDLVEESFDVAIRLGRLDDSSLVMRPLGTLRRVLVAAAGYCKRRGTPRTPDDLTRHAGIAFAGDSAPTVWALHAGDPSNEARAEVRVVARMIVNDFQLVGDAVRAGLGVAWMPDFAVERDVREGRLVRVLPDWHSEDVPMQAVYPTGRHLSPKVSAFVALLVERLGRRPRRATI